MVFIPDDILKELLNSRESLKLDVFMQYAMHSQNEGKAPDAQRLADELEEPVDEVKEVLKFLEEKGWLDQVFDYFE